MKILLLGEFSGLHNNLKDGLEELGHEATVAASGDGFKKIPADISFDSNLPSFLGKIHRRLLPYIKLRHLKNYDVVQMVNPFIFGNNFLAKKLIIDALVKSNKSFFLLAAGDDAFFWRYARKKLKYGPFDDFLKYDLKKSSFYMESDSSYLFNRYLLNCVNGVIPIMYEYECGYIGEEKIINTIPIPINTDKVNYIENKPGRKLTIFHGLNRYGFKGTRHVIKAFEQLSCKYPTDLELIVDGRMPINKYLELMSKTNVVIDQLNSYSLGLNGVYALAMGKVVLGGCEPESLSAINVKYSPVINLEPSAESIIDKVEWLLDNRSKIQDIGYESRMYAENVHGHRIVAQQYLDSWMKYSNK